MFLGGIFSSLPGASGIFLVSLMIVIAASTQFTRKLEELCETFNLSIGLLSLLSAIGANIPNYVSSALAILAGHVDVGIGIIVGSNIYNFAIIVGLCTFFSPERRGLLLDMRERQDVRAIAGYAFIITLLSILVIFWLPGEPLLMAIHAKYLTRLLLLLTAGGVLIVFGALLVHLLKRSHGDKGMPLRHHDHLKRQTFWSLLRLGGEV